MGRPPRVDIGGYCYHVLNRANARATLFSTRQDYVEFERLLRRAVERSDMRVLAFCVMPNHWHFGLWPRRDGDLARFAGWLAQTHALRLRAFRGDLGTGHVYQGRFRAILVKDDSHLLTVCRYVEANPVRARLVPRAQHWEWSSAWLRGRAQAEGLLWDSWPADRPSNWLDLVNVDPCGPREMREAIRKGRPFGDVSWVRERVREFGLTATQHRRS